MRTLLSFLRVFCLLVFPSISAPADFSKPHLDAVDREHPGRGGDVQREVVSDHPMAYALYASAAVHRRDVDLARTSADWLIANAEVSGGWGLKFAWDAFGDGTINPPEAVYGIETALAVRALFDAYGLTSERAYADAGIRALDGYARHFTQTTAGGFFWYSDQASDARQVANVSAALAGQYARAGALFGRKDHADLARDAVAQLFAERKTDSVGGHYWKITGPDSEANDALHAAYVVSGLLEYQKYSAEPPGWSLR